jgi:hypothetical protein
VGGLEIVEEMHRGGRKISHFLCQVSGGGIILNPAMGGADVAQRRRDAKGCALVRTHPVGECLLVGICFFFAPLRDIPSPDLG